MKHFASVLIPAMCKCVCAAAACRCKLDSRLRWISTLVMRPHSLPKGTCMAFWRRSPESHVRSYNLIQQCCCTCLPVSCVNVKYPGLVLDLSVQWQSTQQLAEFWIYRTSSLPAWHQQRILSAFRGPAT